MAKSQVLSFRVYEEERSRFEAVHKHLARLSPVPVTAAAAAKAIFLRGLATFEAPPKEGRKTK
jgi:hypothetical protein